MYSAVFNIRNDPKNPTSLELQYTETNTGCL